MVKLGVLILFLSVVDAQGGGASSLFRYALSAGLEATGEEAAAANSGSY
jgi:hypothetical protein